MKYNDSTQVQWEYEGGRYFWPIGDEILVTVSSSTVRIDHDDFGELFSDSCHGACHGQECAFDVMSRLYENLRIEFSEDD